VEFWHSQYSSCIAVTTRWHVILYLTVTILVYRRVRPPTPTEQCHIQHRSKRKYCMSCRKVQLQADGPAFYWRHHALLPLRRTVGHCEINAPQPINCAINLTFSRIGLQCYQCRFRRSRQQFIGTRFLYIARIFTAAANVTAVQPLVGYTSRVATVAYVGLFCIICLHEQMEVQLLTKQCICLR